MNTSQLISALKLHGSFPSSNDLFSSSDFLSLMNHQMSIELVPMMMKLNEEYFLQKKDFSIGAGLTYRIPKRAIGSNIRNLQVIDSAGNAQSIARLFEEDRPFNKSGYYMLRNSIELSPDFSSNTLRMSYFARPSELVATTSCGQIVSINGNSVDVSAAPSSFSNGTIVDIVQNNNPYDLLAMDVAISSISGVTITFASLPTDLLVGDWICLPVQAPVPMLPEELHPVLVQSSLCKALSSKKDKAYKDELETLMRVKEAALNMLDPRVQNSGNKMKSGLILNYFSSKRY